MNTLKTLAIVGALTAASSVMATQITGTINFNSATTITLSGTGSPLTFPNVTGVNFLNNAISATVNTGSTTGDFAVLAGNVAFQDFTIGTPVSALWSIGLWSFDLATSSNDSGGNTFLNISGTGTVHAPGFDDTDGVFTLSSSRTGGSGQTTFSFQASTTANPEVPDGGATAMLLGVGLLGLGALRRKA